MTLTPAVWAAVPNWRRDKETLPALPGQVSPSVPYRADRSSWLAPDVEIEFSGCTQDPRQLCDRNICFCEKGLPLLWESFNFLQQALDLFAHN